MHLKSLTPTSLPFPIAYILKILLMPSMLTKSCGKLKDIIAALRETRQSLLSIENPTTEDPDSTDSSSVASKTHDDQPHVDFIDDITHCIHILLRTEKMTEDRLCTVIRQLRRLQKNITRFAVFFALSWIIKIKIWF